MAATTRGVELIQGYPPDKVFEVGTLVETLPEGKGFALEADADRFAEGLLVRVGLVVPGHDFHINGEVTEYTPPERVKIEGSSHIGEAAIWLDLSPDEENGGTEISYGVYIKHCFLWRLAEPLVAQHLNNALPRYADYYKQNVVNILNGRHKSARKRAA
jgi:hypothetical protein